MLITHMRYRGLSLMLACMLLSGSILQAGLKFEQTELDLEASLMDEKLEAVFPFENTGDKPVTILDMQSSCGCTVPQLEKRTYAPGETGEIRAIFTFGNRTGQQQKTIRVQTNDPNLPLQNLTFRTDIPILGRVQPQILRWSMDKADEPKQVRVSIGDPEKVKVAEISDSLKHFELKEIASTDTERVYSVVPTSPEDNVTERLIFTLAVQDGEVQKSRELTLYCLIR